MKTPYGVIEYEYVAGQGEVIRKLPNGIWTIWTYEPNGELRQIKHGRVSHATGKSKNWTPIADYTYQYRPDGLIEAIGEGSSNAGQFSVVSRYEYDTVGRLTRAARSDGQTHHYEYDLVGNRLKAVSAGRQAQTCTYDWFGRVMTLNDTPCSHDTAGNLTSLNISGTTMNYRHNLDGQLMAVGEGKVGYRYDGDGRLIVRKAGGTETIFIPDPLSPYWQPLVMDSREGGRTLVIWDRSIPLILIRDGKPAYLLHDHLGSVRIVADELGKINQRIDYDPFGVIENPETEKEFAPRFTGIFWDPEARAYLMFARTFSPYLGRFLQIDPYRRT
jgi:RHS repeat-associated protein